MKLLCRTCTYELDVLLAILRNNGIPTEYHIYVPTPIQGSDMVLWNIFTTEEKLEEASKVLNKEGIAIWVHR